MDMHEAILEQTELQQIFTEEELRDCFDDQVWTEQFYNPRDAIVKKGKPFDKLLYITHGTII